jgi:hypothetical protein
MYILSLQNVVQNTIEIELLGKQTHNTTPNIQHTVRRCLGSLLRMLKRVI